MTNKDFELLATVRAADAVALLAAGRWAGAYYLAGYAVECALKACIAKTVKAGDFPDKDLALRSYTHDLSALLKGAGLEAAFANELKSNPGFRLRWQTIATWNEASRYSVWSEIEARGMVQAAIDTNEGVLRWVAKYF